MVYNNFLHLSFYNPLSVLTPQNPPPNNYDKQNSTTINSTNSNNDPSSAATTVQNFPIDHIAAISPFSNMFSNSDNSSPPPILPNASVASPATPSWIQSDIPTPPLAPTLAELKIDFVYYFFLFDTVMNQLGANMHLFFASTPPAYNTFCDAHNIRMASV
ncbi:hypothetical protein O181_105623 [Austropuccinia psidii MF-1]|uniref:Uncharacterized protein n=1 Tax=Austropuccinia psidii MF-1 TaxID=1389203 RepID=A0A9Q3PL64_9BASI|nr:hypothetical protein [Austropuccinia psidii MF-1]